MTGVQTCALPISEELLHAATLESQRLVSEATAASQGMIERASADSRASIEEATRRHQEIVAGAQERAETLVSDARSHAADVKAAASREAENIRRAAAVYREQVLAGIDHNKDVVAELLDAFSRIREHLGKSEQDALDITAHLHERRSELAEAIVDMRQVPVGPSDAWAVPATANPRASATAATIRIPETSAPPPCALPRSCPIAADYGKGYRLRLQHRRSPWGTSRRSRPRKHLKPMNGNCVSTLRRLSGSRRAMTGTRQWPTT